MASGNFIFAVRFSWMVRSAIASLKGKTSAKEINLAASYFSPESNRLNPKNSIFEITEILKSSVSMAVIFSLAEADNEPLK